MDFDESLLTFGCRSEMKPTKWLAESTRKKKIDMRKVVYLSLSVLVASGMIMLWLYSLIYSFVCAMYVI